MTDLKQDTEKKSLGIRFVKIATQASALGFWFLLVFSPYGVTVPWESYFETYGVLFAVALVSLIGFIVVRVGGQKISFVYAVVTVAIILWVLYVTWFVLRLRWFLIFHD